MRYNKSLPSPDGDRLVNIRKGNFNIFSEKLPSPDGDCLFRGCRSNKSKYNVTTVP